MEPPTKTKQIKKTKHLNTPKQYLTTMQTQKRTKKTPQCNDEKIWREVQYIIAENGDDNEERRNRLYWLVKRICEEGELGEEDEQ